MLNLDPALDGLRQSSVHRYATLWRLELTDGTTFLFTDHDVPLVFNYQKALNDRLNPGAPIDGADETYSPVQAVSATAVQKNAGLKEHNVDVSAVISSDLITEDDLRAGKYRDARVVEMLVDYNFPYAGYFYQNTYWIVTTTFTREVWQAQISGVPSWMQTQIGHNYTHSCRHTLGDSLCKVDLSGFTLTGTVSGLSDSRSFAATGTDTDDDYYADGTLTWLTGNNTGQTYDVQGNTGGMITTFLNVMQPIQIGDTFTIVAGCNRLKGTCTSKFSNFVNFGGFPFIPGNDTMLRGAIG